MAMLPASSLTRKAGVAACPRCHVDRWGESSAPSSFWRRASAPRDHPHRRALLAAVTADGRCCQGGVLPAQSPTFSCFRNFSRLSATSATTSWKWFWQTKTAGTDTRRPSGSPCADGLKTNPDDELAKDVRAKLTSEPERYAAYTREYLGWGAFAVMRGLPGDSRKWGKSNHA